MADIAGLCFMLWPLVLLVNENEIKSIKHIQELYINALSRETCMTKRTIQKLLDRKVNVYLTAEEAVEYGIADTIIN